MAPFVVEEQSDYGRLGKVDTSNGTIETPALYPVLNFIAGTTIESGGIWKYTRERLLKQGSVPAVMMQAMGFLDYNLSAENLNEFWREKPLHDHYEYLDRPLFIDSGGFKLMNSNTFGEAPKEGGAENQWGIYTNPESILDLQLDYGADIIATLDYPIPPNLKEDEKVDRMERSIESAVECLALLEERSESPAVYIAIHGHDYEDINWYVSQFLEAAEEYGDAFEGFAVGSLVPIASSQKVDILVDIIQGAKDAIPNNRTDKIGLHAFGVTGRLVPLLALLGVDSFDSASYQRAAQYKKFIHPETWEKIEAKNLPADWSCSCDACQPLDIEEMNEVLYSDVSNKRINGFLKSEFYALIAHHNYESYRTEINRIHEAIADDGLLDHVIEVAKDHDIVKAGLKHAQLRDSTLRADIRARDEPTVLAGPATGTFQTKLPGFSGNGDPTDASSRTISLEHSPSDFDVLQRDYVPPADRSVLLVIPCSQQKPYRKSRTQQVVLDAVDSFRPKVHKVTVSGLYGPVPEEFEDEEMVLEYEYVLTTADTTQSKLVTDRLVRYLAEFGERYDEIVGYATSNAYRHVIENAFASYERGTMLPRDPQANQLTEHFRRTNLAELTEFMEEQV